MVKARGIWGECQVWAASVDEGKRVIRHGLNFGGFDPDDINQGEWSVGVASGRNGQGGTYAPAVTRYGVMVSKRDGPNGSPDGTFLFPPGL